ncbi:MAG: hypothetical protein IKI76_03955 [Selenomonadaceae bacterium]|nr:hypothetical protein [Selenomonadaceae bacterium]
MGVRELASAIKRVVDERIKREARAMRGTIQNGVFQSGSKSYPYKQAVECNTSSGSRVWALPSQNGDAVIVGA